MEVHTGDRFLFCGKSFRYLSSIKAIQRTQEVKTISRTVDHLATTTSTEASRRRAAVIAPPSLEPSKPYCSRQSESRGAKDQRTKIAIAADEEKRRSKDPI